MTGLSLGLILLSALAHASWNLLLKGSGDKEVFAWWLLVSASVTFLPLGVWLYWAYPVPQPGWPMVAASIGLQAFYFILLSRGYVQGELSLVYPIARGTGPMLVPILAVILLGESIGLLAIAGIVTVILGIYVVSWWGSFGSIFRTPMKALGHTGVSYALLTGLTISAYTLVDKRGVAHVQPFLYMYLTVSGAALALSPYVFARRNLAVLRAELRTRALAIWVSGLLTFVAYGLVLTAFSLSRVSYVAPAREVGIVIGVLLGALILKEPFGPGRLLGSIFVVLGVVMISLSP